MRTRILSFTATAGVACLVACGSETSLGGFEHDAGSHDAGERTLDSGADGGPADAALDVQATDDAADGEEGEGGDGGACNPALFSISGSVGLLPPPSCDVAGWWWTNPSLGGSGPQNEITIVFMDRPAVCATGSPRSGGTALSMGIHAPDALLVPRTYPVVFAPEIGQAFGILDRRGAACEIADNYNATSGTISITAMSGTMISGAFELTFAEGTLTGSFDVPVCNGPILSGCAP